MAKKEYFSKAINWAKRQGFTNIKANCDGYNQPSQFTKADSKNTFTPDVTGSKFGKKIYIEIATKPENIQREVSKWKLLSTLARLKGGKLFLLAPKGHKAFTERILKTYNLNNAHVISLPGI
jgi:hypothetical protein